MQLKNTNVALTGSAMMLLASIANAKGTANDVLLSREDAAKTGFANFLAVISAWFNNAYYLGLGFAFIAGFFMFIFAWTKLKKEKEKPEEQQETTKFYWFMGIGVALMSVTAIILAMADTLGIGSGIGQGIEGDKLDSNKTGYGVGNSGSATGFTK